MVIDTNLPKLIDDDRNAMAVIGREDSIEERCFARPEKAGQDDDGSFFRSVAIVHINKSMSEDAANQPRVKA